MTAHRRIKRLANALLLVSAILPGAFLVCAMLRPTAPAPSVNHPIYSYFNPLNASSTASNVPAAINGGRSISALSVADWERFSLAFGWGLVCLALIWFLPRESGKRPQAQQSPNFVAAFRPALAVQKQDIRVAKPDSFGSGINCRIAWRPALVGPKIHARCRPRTRLPALDRTRMPPRRFIN